MQIPGKHAHQVTLLTYIELRKFGKIRYISNLLDFFRRNNFELTKKKSFTRVSSRRKRLQTQGSWLVYDDLTDVISYLPSSPITVGT